MWPEGRGGLFVYLKSTASQQLRSDSRSGSTYIADRPQRLSCSCIQREPGSPTIAVTAPRPLSSEQFNKQPSAQRDMRSAVHDHVQPIAFERVDRPRLRRDRHSVRTERGDERIRHLFSLIYTALSPQLIRQAHLMCRSIHMPHSPFRV